MSSVISDINQPLAYKFSGNLKCFLLLVFLYLTTKLITILTIYKIVSIGPLTLSISALIMPLWFFLGDIITEVYGYRIMKHVIWAVLLCQMIFSFICWAAIQLPSPPTFHHQQAYQQVLGNLPRVVLASFAAIFLGTFVNAYLLTKWKVITKGKYFIGRSLVSTMIGEFIFTLTAYSLEFFGKVPTGLIINLFLTSYGIKLLVNLCSSFPAYLIVNFIRKIEGENIFEPNAKLNPFILKD